MYLYSDMNKNKILALSSAITDFLETIDIDDLIMQLYVTSDNPNTWELIKRFEGIILDCKLKPEKSMENIERFLENNTKFIKENNLQRDFFDFLYFVYVHNYNRISDKKVPSAYLSMVIEQLNYLNEKKNKVVGIKTDGSLITMPEVYPNLEHATLDFYTKSQKKKGAFDQLKLLKECYKRYGYNIKKPEDIAILNNNEQAISVELVSLSPIIDEDYEDMLPTPAYEPYSSLYVPIRQWFGTEKYKEHLKTRKFMLPHKGVTCIFKNAGNIKEITFREKCLEDKIIMLYKAKMYNDKFISGFYDTSLEFFNDIWKCSGTWQSTINTWQRSENLENFILEVYAHLTTDMKVERKKNAGLLIVEDINNTGFYFDTQPVMQIFKLSHSSKPDGTKEIIRKPFNKSEFIEVTKFIQPLIRKLPEGAKASEEAKSLALSLGYELNDGETFVRPYKKNVHIKKD